VPSRRTKRRGLLPGTEIAFANDIQVRSVFRSIRNWIRGTITGERVARFRKIRMDDANVHHDAIVSDAISVCIAKLARYGLCSWTRP
jgi:hypothetical protein